jgi:hypothetical protein
MPYRDPEARKRYVAEYYKRNRVKILEYAARYRAEHPEAITETKKRIYHERYKVDPAYKAAQSEYQKTRRREHTAHVKAIEKRYRETHPEAGQRINQRWNKTPERRARTTVNRAVRTGKLPRASTQQCVSCGQPAKEYHHHKGYAREHWLDVEPVCHQCHKDDHFGSHST